MKRSRFVGRTDELELLSRELARAADNEPRLVLLEGEAGIGKTRLVREFLQNAPDLHVLRAIGEDAAAVAPYDVMSQFGVERLLVESEPTPRWKQPLEVGAELLTLLGELQDEGVLSVVVDDAHWADPMSLQALLFALRRLQRDRVLTIMAFRGDAGVPDGFRRLSALGGCEMNLSGLPLPDFGEYVASMSPDRPSERAVRRVWEHTGGNPLYASALLEELLPDELESADLLPAPRSFAASVIRRLSECSPDTQALLAGAAVLGQSTPLSRVRDVAGIVDGASAVEEAIAAGLLEPGLVSPAMMVRFGHPLVRASIYHHETFVERVRFHRRAADASSDPLETLRHRVAATEGHDGGLAEELASHAAAERHVGAWAVAGALYLDAARLSPVAEDSAEWHWCAVECWLEAGDVHEATRLADRAPPTDDVVRRSAALGGLAIASGRFGDAERVLSDAWEHQTLASNPAGGRLRRALAARLSQLFLVQGRGSDAALWGERAADADAAEARTTHRLGSTTLGLAISGRIADALAGVEWVNTSGDRLPASAIDAATSRGIVRMFADDLDGARTDLTAVVDVGRDRGPHDRLAQAHGYLAEVEYRSGRWDSSVVHGELALSIALDADQVWMLAFLRAEASWVWARRGWWEAAAIHVDAARAAAEMVPISANRGYAATAAAVLAHSQADPAGVISATDSLMTVLDVDGILEPGVLCWPELRAEALAHVDRFADADNLLDRMIVVAEDRGRHSTLTAAHRVAGVLDSVRGRHARAAAQFERAIEHDELAPQPFEGALLHLQYGAHLRRRGQRRKAEDHLRTAETTMSRLGAAPFLTTVVAELAACGMTPRSRTTPDRLKLTPQELAVAHLVADGLSNRDIAHRLVVSLKTVEYHLRNVYIKLGVTSRVQLTNFLANSIIAPQLDPPPNPHGR